MNASILISGVGIAGPTMAYWLGQYGFEPTLIENARHLRTGGYMIDFWGRGFDIAERMGLGAGLQRQSYPVSEVRFVDRGGRRVGGFDTKVINRLTNGQFVSLPRGDLARLIYETIEHRFEVILGDTITSIDQDEYRAVVTFANAARRRFDLIIGADGLHSRVRELTFGTQSEFESHLGYCAAAFEAAHYRPRDEGVYVCHAVPGKQVTRFALRDDRTLFLFVFASPRRASLDLDVIGGQKALVHREFEGAGWECRNILELLERARELYFDSVSQIQMPRWHQGRVALVGDAAFCPSLLAGQGAALAMIASYVLACELGTARGNHRLALSRYERLLRPFLETKQEAAKRFARVFTPKTSFGVSLRNWMSGALEWPVLADMALGRSLRDRLDLPDC